MRLKLQTPYLSRTFAPGWSVPEDNAIVGANLRTAFHGG